MLTQVDTIIAEKRLQGATCREIAKTTGLSFATIARRLRGEGKGETKAFLDKLQNAFMGRTLARAFSNIDHAVHAYLNKDTTEQEKERGFKASMKVMEAHGLLPSHTQSIYIQQIYNDNRTEMPEGIKQLFAAVTHNDSNTTGLLDSDQVIDVKVEEK
jgi:transcriptional regulator with XRE-family HTH domain